jgi:hypothetical protein
MTVLSCANSEQSVAGRGGASPVPLIEWACGCEGHGCDEEAEPDPDGAGAKAILTSLWNDREGWRMVDDSPGGEMRDVPPTEWLHKQLSDVRRYQRQRPASMPILTLDLRAPTGEGSTS